METNGSDHHPHENHLSTGLNNDNKDQSTEKEVFVNHAEITWLEIRRQWVGDQTQKSKRMPQEPIMSWTSTYYDLLCSTELFQQPIPLAEMVDFLVDIWHEEGLYD
ncbi:uncharacterized protein LOC111293719 isoform X1 [Durio zibethinus]|uniref:Uncharacterized protein LOC111293719 isoform X1 n=1 Tax=Durio zibethinus TaxID=66656 RepID=A0A6P5YPA4_DURZI|nr:uncharacterized protein LOC111293719 isoform X1 [Durio zibethinus]XP_022742338.1 uncharacterized protein LOC111293719 isoform X1 [Durio zibethinus]